MGIFGALLQQELDRKAGSFLGVDTFKIAADPSQRLDLSRAELTVGTYLSSKFYVEYSRRLSMESGEQVGVEYSLGRNLSLQGNRNSLGLYRLGFSLKWDY
jgi:autotransporter translocation and assembly factor TamB